MKTTLNVVAVLAVPAMMTDGWITSRVNARFVTVVSKSKG